MTLDQLKSKAVDLIQSYPDKSEEIKEMLSLCLSEIDAGESEAHEIELCENSWDEIINED